MAKKWLLSLLITFCITVFASYIVSNTKIGFDKNSKYKIDLPDKMRVAHIKNESDRNFYKNIYIDKRDIPEIDENEVLVYVKSATFTSRDYDFFKRNPGRKEFVPCSDFSGVIVKVGNKVKTYEVGDRVFGIADIDNNNGACADYVAVPQNNIYTIPYSLTFKQSAMIPTPSLLNWLALHNLNKQGISKGEVLIDNAISEDGIMLTGLLSQNGFKVTAIDDESVETWAKGLGVDKFIANTDIDENFLKLRYNYDVVINLRDGIPATTMAKFLKRNGTFISLEPISITRNDIKTVVIDNKKISKDVFAKMARLVHLGKLRINIVKEFSLEHVRDAYIRAIKGNNNGKVVVNVNP